MRVVDADTLELKIALWPGLDGSYSVRVRGIVAPEIYRPCCDLEKVMGIKAKRQVERLYDAGSTVRVENVVLSSFAGRVVADISRWRSDRWLFLSEELMERDIAYAWSHGQAQINWCAK